MQRILSLILRWLGKLPWFFWDGVGKVLYFFLVVLLRYRQAVILENLQKAFPEKRKDEIRLIQIQFYKHLCNLMIETLKSFGFSRQEVKKAIRIVENDATREILNRDSNAILLFGHYHNWEFITQGCGVYFTGEKQQHMIGFYKTIRNKTVESLMNTNRTRFGGDMFSDRQPRPVIKILTGKNKTLLGMVADQTPPGRDQMFVIEFLGRPTPFFTGPGWIAAAARVPVYYGRMVQTGSHQYKIIPEKLFEPDPTLSKEEIIQAITLAYARKLEAQIREFPQFWLWSHRRWKYLP